LLAVGQLSVNLSVRLVSLNLQIPTRSKPALDILCAVLFHGANQVIKGVGKRRDNDLALRRIRVRTARRTAGPTLTCMIPRAFVIRFYGNDSLA
jgi:hypothetical protein